MAHRPDANLFCVFGFTSRHATRAFVGADHINEAISSVFVGQPEELIETEILVTWHARGRYRYSHTKKRLEKNYPASGFYCVVALSTLCKLQEAARREALHSTEELKRALRSTNCHSREIELSELPEALVKMISIDRHGCWLWRGGRDQYGVVQWNGKRWLAHRLVYTLAIGTLPRAALLRHDCDKPGCVNPDHLRPGTPADNVEDMLSRGRGHWQKIYAAREYRKRLRVAAKLRAQNSS